MSRATDHLSDGPEGRLSRREVVRLVSGAIAMSAVLGVPASLRAEAYQGGKRRPQVQIKYYWTDERSEATLMHREALPPELVEMLLSGDAASLQIKWYDTTERDPRNLGTQVLARDLLAGLQEMRDRLFIKLDGVEAGE